MPDAREDWFPAVGEPSILGRFGYTDILDVAASLVKDEKIYKPIVVLFTKSIGEIDKPGPIKVLPSNQKELMLRFPEAWRAFEGEDVGAGGTPLNSLKLSADKIIELRIFGVTRMENLAALTDQQCDNMGFGTKSLRAQAREALGLPPISVGPMMATPPVAAVAALPAEPSVPLASVQKMVADAVAAALKAQAVPPPAKRRGRPPKAAADQAAA